MSPLEHPAWLELQQEQEPPAFALPAATSDNVHQLVIGYSVCQPKLGMGEASLSLAGKLLLSTEWAVCAQYLTPFVADLHSAICKACHRWH